MSTHSNRFERLFLAIPAMLVLSACGGGGGSSQVSTPPPTVTLTSIALGPSAVSLAPGGATQLTVTGTYSDGTTKTLAASGETFSSSNPTVATVSAAGVLSVAAAAAIGATATITAKDTASGIATTTATSTVVTVVSTASVGPPTANSKAAIEDTAMNNALCQRISPFYWEIGNASGALDSGSVGVDNNGQPYSSSSKFSIASASKWIYGIYVVQKRGGVNNLTPDDISFLHFTSGYTYMGSDTTTSTCPPPTSGNDSINACLTLPGTYGPFDGQNPATIGVFDYDSGHEENHAGQFQPEINALDTSALGPQIVAGLGLTGVISLNYTQPLLAGGIYASADDYTPILRAILSGTLLMRDALGTSPVCAFLKGTCTDGPLAVATPIVTENWHYSIAHWVEDDATQNNDGSFSSPGAFGFYPWINAAKTYYGVIARYVPTGGGIQNGLASAQCGVLMRAAWTTGVEQTGSIPQ
jgi:hypothetical protein